MKYLQDFDWKISGTAFHILEKSMCQSLENKLLLTTKHMFQQMLQVLKCGTVNHKKSCMYFIASIVNGNVLGQTLVRESGCLDYLLHLCHETMQITTPSKEDYWNFLCAAINMCVNNPQNFTNQYQTSHIIPKAITFLEYWFHQAFNKYFSEYVHILTGLLVNIVAGNPTNQLCFSVYSGIETIIRGLNLLNEWQDAPLNITNVLEKLVILLDVVIYNNSENCEKAALQGVVSLMLKMLPKFKQQQKFSLLMTLTHLIGGSSNNKKEFIKENGITTIVVATVNHKEDSRIGNAANMLIKLCADTALQQKEDSTILDFEHDDKENDSRKLVSSENYISRKQLDVSTFENKEAQTDDITACSCCFSSKNQDKIYSHYKMGQDSNDLFSVMEDKFSHCTPLRHISKTLQNPNTYDGIPIKTCISNMGYHITADNHDKENIVNNSELNSSVFQKQHNIGVHQLFPKTTREPLCKTASNSIKNNHFQNRNENIFHIMPKQEHNPNISLQIGKNQPVYEHCTVFHSPKKRSTGISMVNERSPFQENNLHSAKQLHFVPGNAETSHSTDVSCKSSQNNTILRSNTLKINVPAFTKRHQIIVDKMAMSHDMMYRPTKEHSVPQLFTSSDFQINSTAQNNTQQLNFKPKDISCKIGSKFETFHNKDDNREMEINLLHGISDMNQESYNENINRNLHPRLSRSEWYFDKAHLDIREEERTPDMRKESHNRTENQNTHSRSQFLHSFSHLENNNSEIKKQKDSLRAYDGSDNKKINQKSYPRTSQCKHMQSTISEADKQNSISSTKKLSHNETLDQNIHPITLKCQHSKHAQSTSSKLNKQASTSRIREEPHNGTLDQNIHPITSEILHFKHHLGNIHSERDKQKNSTANQSINPRTSQYSHAKQYIRNSNLELSKKQNVLITRAVCHHENTNESIQPASPQLSHSRQCVPVHNHLHVIQNNNFLKNISAHNDNDDNASVIDLTMITASTNDESELHSMSRSNQHQHDYKLKSKTENDNTGFQTHENLKVSMPQVISNRNKTTCNRTKAGCFTPSSNINDDHNDKVNYLQSHLSSIGTEKRNKTSQEFMHSFDSIQSSKKSVRSIQSFVVQTSATVKEKSNNNHNCKFEHNVENMSNFKENKILNSTLNLEDSHAVNGTIINEISLRSNENKFHASNISLSSIKTDSNRASASNTLCYQRHGIKQRTDEEVDDDIKYTSIDSDLTNASKDTSLRSSYPLEEKMQSKEQVSSSKYYRTFKRPMLKYTKMELDNLVAGVAKYGLDFKAIRRAYTFHSKRTSKDLYLKWRYSFINSRKYHGPGPQIQDCNQSSVTHLHKNE